MGGVAMSRDILRFSDHLISISDFSKGKTAKIFDDVKNNKAEYIVLKNNQPTAMVVSMESYKELIDKATIMEFLFERIDESRLFNLAEGRMNNADTNSFKLFDDVVRGFGFDPEEIEKDCESVEIE